MLGRMSLPGNRKLNTSMDTLASPILLRGCCCMATDNRTDGVSVGATRCCIEKTRHYRDQTSSCHRVARDQFSTVSE
jgi:hypothetical protein